MCFVKGQVFIKKVDCSFVNEFSIRNQYCLGKVFSWSRNYSECMAVDRWECPVQKGDARMNCTKKTNV